MNDKNEEQGYEEFREDLQSALDSLADAIGTWSPRVDEIESAMAEIAAVFERNCSDVDDMATLEELLTKRKLAGAARAADKIRAEIETVPSDADDRAAAAQTASEWAEVLLDELRDYCDNLPTE